MTFAKMLTTAMGSMSQADLADKSGLRQATISRLVNGQRQPSYEALVALERVLPVLVDLRKTAA